MIKSLAVFCGLVAGSSASASQFEWTDILLEQTKAFQAPVIESLGGPSLRGGDADYVPYVFGCFSMKLTIKSLEF